MRLSFLLAHISTRWALKSTDCTYVGLLGTLEYMRCPHHERTGNDCKTDPLGASCSLVCGFVQELYSGHSPCYEPVCFLLMLYTSCCCILHMHTYPIHSDTTWASRISSSASSRAGTVLGGNRLALNPV